MSKPRFNKAIVVGGSSGIGREIAMQLAQSGCQVAVVARRSNMLEPLSRAHPENIFPIVHDVTRIDSASTTFDEIVTLLGDIDVIFYCAGLMERVGINEFDTAKDKAMIDTNFAGAVAWLNKAATHFQEKGSGTIVGIGSVAGDRGRRGQPVYNATKAALATYLESLRNRLSRLGVTVVTIKPGPVETPMTEGLPLKGALSATKAAELILKKSSKSGEHYLVWTHRLIFAIIRLIPSSIFRRLNC